MFGSTILDVAAGIVFGFLAISLFTSAAVEAINSLFNVRVTNLKTGIMALVNDPNFTGLAKQLYQHASINPLGPGGVDPLKNAPAYIDKMQFASAMLDITGLSTLVATAAAHAPAAQTADALKAQVEALNAQIAEISDPQIRQLLQGIVNRSAGDVERIKTELANWFDNAMDRLSGEFKRWTQVLTFVIALIVALVVNLDTIRVGTLLWEQPALADKLKSPSLPSPATPKNADDAIQSGEVTLSVIARMAEDGLPVGWPPGHFFEIRDDQGQWRALWVASPSHFVAVDPRLVHHGDRRAVRRPILVRHAPVHHSSERIGPQPGRESQPSSRVKLGSSGHVLEAERAAWRPASNKGSHPIPAKPADRIRRACPIGPPPL